jgi:prepilin peptidase CpaA
VPVDASRLVWLGAYAAMLAAAAGWDASARRIPNALVFWGAAVAFAIACTPSGIGPGAAIGGFAAGLAIGFPLYAARLFGAGDAKLLAAAGTFVGFPQVLVLMLYAFVAGGVLAIAWALARGQLGRAAANLATGFRRAILAIRVRSLPGAQDLPVLAERLPFAVAIALGAAAHLAFGATAPWSPPS